MVWLTLRGISWHRPTCRRPIWNRYSMVYRSLVVGSNVYSVYHMGRAKDEYYRPIRILHAGMHFIRNWPAHHSLYSCIIANAIVQEKVYREKK